MAVVNQPPILASSFAVNGDKNTIPTTNSGTEGLASLSLGFPPITQQPVSQGGIPPQRADFNGIFNLITNFLMFIQNGSIFAYSSSLDYQPPAIVYGNNALYRCIATNGANTSAGVQPLSNTSYWQPLIPVGGITVSGNTITVTNETGTQIRYTIDTITNPPSQSDSSNKIVTSAWVKAYAPSKTGSGASGTWNITATKATQDSDGNAINTTYVKKVNGTADGLTCVDDTFGGQLTVKRNSANATTIKFTNTSNVNRYIGFTSYDKVMYRWGDNGDGQTAFLDASNYNNYAPTKTGGGASGTWNISISGNAKTSSSTPILSSKGVIGASSLPNTFSTGLTTHSDYNGGYPAQYGNVININNRGKSQLLLEWRGDDVALSDPGHLYYRECRDTQNVWSNWKKIAFTSDNVASATKATQDSDGKQINTTYLKRNQTTQNDMNACTVEGIYRFSGTLSNAWTSQAWGTLLVFNNHFNGASGVNDTFLVQLAFPTDGKIWTRQRVNTGAWSSWLKVAHITDNVASATKATQDKNGRDITGYLYKNEALSLTSDAPIVGSGATIIPLLNAFCAKFKQIQGTGAYVESPPTTLKSLNDNKAPKASPAFSGTPTAPTPGTSDNGTRIATTAFVQSLINSKGTIIASSLGTNGYVKFSNGFIVQWGRGSGTYCTFPIAFPNACFTAIGMLVRETKGEVAMSQPTKTGVQFHSYEDPWNFVAFGN